MSHQDLLPVTGVLRGKTHVLPIRVYYEDTDAGGIVYHASYLRFAERGRTEMLRSVGIELGRLRKDEDLIFVVNKADMQYRQSAVLDDRLVVETTVRELSGASVHLDQSIHKLDMDGQRDAELFSFHVHVACMNGNGRATRIPAVVRDKFEELL